MHTHTSRFALRPIGAAMVFLAAALLLGATPASTPIQGTPGPDRLGGTNGADRIEAGGGNDVIMAGDGDDIVRGGTGRDSYELGSGNDSILLSPGDGQDVVAGFDNAPNKRDQIVFDSRIKPVDVKIFRQPVYALVIQYGRSDKIIVPRHFEADGNSGFRIDQIRFGDGKVWNADVIRQQALLTRPTPQYIVGYTASEKLDGGEGNDQVYGGFGNDEVRGGLGNDRVYGDEGNDTLLGGAGNDVMRGEMGSDTYLYRGGDGFDTIQNFSREGDVDVIRFVNHTRAAVDIKAKGTDLILTVNGDPKTGLRILGFNGSSTYPLARIEYRESKPTLYPELAALYPVPAKRLNGKRESSRLANQRPKREPPPKPVATHRIRTPLESLVNDAAKTDAAAAETATVDAAPATGGQ